MSEDVMVELDKEQQEKIEEFRKKMKERRYLRSLTLMELGTELHNAEKQIKDLRKNGNESRLKKMEEYKEKLMKEINGRLDSMDAHYYGEEQE